MATARGAAEAGAADLDTPIMPPIVEPSAEEGAAKKKSKKRKVAEADAVQAQAAEAAQDGGAAPGLWFCVLSMHGQYFVERCGRKLMCGWQAEGWPCVLVLR